MVAADDVRLAGLVRRYQVPNERLDLLVPFIHLQAVQQLEFKGEKCISMARTERFSSIIRSRKKVSDVKFEKYNSV